MARDRRYYSVFFALAGALFFLPFLGGVHLFDWDEINFAEISREMMLTGDYLRIYVDFLPFWEKPPFYFWMQSLAMYLFGVGAYAARFPNAVCGIITLVVLYNIGKTLYDHRFGFIWAMVYLGSILPHLYFKSGIIDPFFNLFIFLGLYFFILFVWKKENHPGINLKQNKWVYLFWAGFIVGMGILTKGQVAFLIAALTFFVYWIFQRFRMYVNIPEFLFFVVATTIVSLTWYGLEYWQHGPWFITEFNKYQYRLFSTPDAGHKGFFGYHFVVLLIGCFPASIFAIHSFFSMPSQDHFYQHDFTRWMKILFWVVLILFSIVKSKIVHYSSMCYFPLSFLATLVIFEIIRNNIVINRWIKIGLGVIGGIFIFALLIASLIAQHPDPIAIGWIAHFFDDPFAKATLEANVNWTGWEVIPAFLLLLILIFFFRQSKTNLFQAFKILFFGTALFITITLIFYINRIEGYSQNAAIEFFKSKQGEDCYVIPHGYKSYGHLFYTQKPLVRNEKSYDKMWLLTGDIDKDVFIVTKIHKAFEIEKYKAFQEIGRKNGFVFFKRKAN